jgi:subtilisin family serine protease
MNQDCISRIISEDYADFIYEYSREIEAIEAEPNTCYDIIDNVFAVLFYPVNLIPANSIQLYGYSVYPRCYGLLDIGSIEASGVRRIQNIPTLNLSGQGVLVGIIDTGIDYTHKAFKAADGTSRILSIWDQTIQDGPPPEGFYYGTEYTKEQINDALLSEDPLSVVPSVDDIGHGTMLAGIAAGTVDDTNNFSGIAIQSEIVAVKLKPAKRYLKNFLRIPEETLCFQENDIMYAAKYLVDYASRLNRPIAICLGLGSSQGAHDARGNLNVYLASLAQKNGVGIILAAGNEGTNGTHFQATLARGTKSQTVELRVGSNEYGFTMELWGDAPNTFSIDIMSPTGEYIPIIQARLGESRILNFIFEETTINLDFQFVEAQTGAQLILMRFLKPSEGIWRFQVYPSIEVNAHFHIWLPLRQFMGSDTRFTAPDPEYTLTSPANVIIPIVSTAYDYKTQSLYLSASKGYTRTNNVKPDIAAPGVNLVVPTFNNGYITATGTSLAAAHVTGIAALLLEWGIVLGNSLNMDSIELKNLLIRGARRDANVTYPNKQWGYGIVDIYRTFESLRGDSQ